MAPVSSLRSWKRVAIFALALGLGCGWLLHATIGGTSRPDVVVATELSVVERIRSLVNTSSPQRHWKLSDAISEIADSLEPKDVYWRGVARKHLGQFVRARHDMEQLAKQGFDGADLQLEVLQHYMGNLFNRLLDEPPWIRQGFRLLPEPEQTAARAQNASDRLTLRVLGLYTKGAESEARDLLGKKQESEYIALGLVRMLVEGNVDAMPELIDRIDRRAAMRYLLEALFAYRTRNLPRLRAACELAALAEDSDFATALFASCLIGLAQQQVAGAALRKDEARRWLQLLQGLDEGKYPALATTRFFLALASDDAQARQDTLQTIGKSQDPQMAYFKSWQEADAGDQGLFAGLTLSNLGLVERGKVQLQAWLQAFNARKSTGMSSAEIEIDLARACVAISVMEVELARRLFPELADKMSSMLLHVLPTGKALRSFQAELALHDRKNRSKKFVRELCLRAANTALDKSMKTELIVPALKLARERGADLTPIFKRDKKLEDAMDR